MTAYVYTRQDGQNYVVRASTLEHAQRAVQTSEQKRTGSIAAGQKAARTLKVYGK